MTGEKINAASRGTGLDAVSHRLREVVDHLHEGLQLLDRDLRYVYLNDVALVHARRPREELIGVRMCDAYPGIEQTAMYAQLLRCLETGEWARFENEFEYGDGRRASFELSMQPLEDGIVVLSTDVTARNELQSQLRHSQKMEAVGRLASSVAHDFNNLLTVIDSFGQLAIDALPKASAVRQDIAEIRRAAGRAAELTRKLLAFARNKPIRPAVLDLNALVHDMQGMLGRLIPQNLRVAMHLGQGLWSVEIDPGSMEQVLLNIVLNARDASSTGGIITIETRNLHVETTLHVRWGKPIPPGDYVVLAISDTGTGIAREHLERIFEPFFTTKPPGQGTGLGLSVCLGIVEQAGGYLVVYTEPGHGTTFRVYLPRARTDAPAPHAALGPPVASPTTSSDATIAVVEDDPQVRELMLRSLRAAGYTALDVPSEPSAREVLRSMSHLDLLITDVMMPCLDGPSLVRDLRGASPNLRVLYVSGYPGGAVLERALLAAGEPFLEKPFTPDALSRAVTMALGR